MATYVLVLGRLHRLEDQAAFEANFEQVSRTVVNSVEGIIRDELIVDSKDPYSYIMLSEWESENAWATWQRAPIHDTGRRMQQYWRGQGVKIYNTTFCVEKAEGAKREESGRLILLILHGTYDEKFRGEMIMSLDIDNLLRPEFLADPCPG